MNAGNDRIVVTPNSAAAGGTTVHHRDFPEIRAEGASPGDAAGQLVNKLTAALDTALTNWRREAIQSAINDAQAFASQPA